MTVSTIRTGASAPTRASAADDAPTVKPFKSVGAPGLDAGMIPEGMGIEYLAAMLMSEAAKENKKLMRELRQDAKEAQVAAMKEQAEHLHEKAADMVSEGLVNGAITIAGGALTIASAYAGPSPSDAGKAAQWEEAGKEYGHGFSVVSAQCKATIDAQTRTASALGQLGTTTNGLAGSIAKATYGAQQIEDDADATRAASDAKFAEAARDEYASLARDFEAGSAKALQILQAITADRQAVRRGLMQRM